jgi:porin
MFYRDKLKHVLIGGMLSAFAAAPALAQGTDVESPMLGSADVSGVPKIGRLHRRIQRSTWWEELNRDLTGAYSDYSRFKGEVKKETGLSWSMPVSYLHQWGRPGGGSSAGQMLATPGLDWELFNSKTFGAGSLQLAYTWVHYPGQKTSADIADNLGTITQINDFPDGANSFPQLTYTQAFPGNRVLLSVGQYPFYNFDDNQYLADQQQNFDNLIFTQNGTSTYPIAGLGAYAQVNVTSTIQLASGFQNAKNITGKDLSSDGFAADNFAWFGYAQWTPRFHGLGDAQYSFTYYDVPSVPEQPRSSTGWSVNLVQNLNRTWAVFGRANGASGYKTPIQTSYVIGGAMNNPLGRSAMDQIGLAIGTADAAGSPTNPPGTRDEKVIEAYWNWAFFGGLLLTPDVQYINDPAKDTGHDNVWALSLRATMLF